MTIKYYTIILAASLASCADMGIRPTWSELWTAPDTRTDLVETQLILNVVPYAEMKVRCAHLSLLAQACFVSGQVVMQSYSGSWPEGFYTTPVRIQFLSWKDIGKKCGRVFGAPVCSEDGTIYTYDYSIADVEKMGYIGQELASMLGLPVKQINAENTLGHEFWHVLGRDDVKVFGWSVYNTDYHNN